MTTADHANTVRKRSLAKRTTLLGQPNDWIGWYLINEEELDALQAQAEERDALRESGQRWAENVRVKEQRIVAAEAERDRLERINARLTKDLADLQRANDHLRWQIKEMHRAALAGEDT